MSKLNDIEKLIADFQRSGARELHVRADGVEIYLSNDANMPGLDGQAAPQVPAARPAAAAPVAPAPAPAAAAPAAASAAAAAVDVPAGGVVITAPYLGTFYRAPKPGAAAYVEIGGSVQPDTEMCLVEVMKLFTAVRAGVAGTVHAVLATDGQMVEADQPLFIVMPA